MTGGVVGDCDLDKGDLDKGAGGDCSVRVARACMWSWGVVMWSVPFYTLVDLVVY